jgi:hypothetical protein
MNTASDASPPEFLEPVLPIPPRGPRSMARRVLPPIALLAIVGALFFYWLTLHRHLMALASISLQGGQVDWDGTEGKWLRGGESSVSFDMFGQSGNDDSFRSVVDLNHVVSLDLSNAGRIPLKSYERLRELPELRVLSLSRTSMNSDPRALYLTDDELRWISGHHELVDLSLDGNPITDKGLARLADLPKLEFMDLSHTGVTDAGLMHLLAFPNLKTVNLDGARITDAGVTAFATRRPEIEIVRPDSKSVELDFGR